jgi:dienelactone hydrolase
MQHETLIYKDGAKECKGHVIFNPNEKNKRPAVLVAHDWQGTGPYHRQIAKDLAELGYVGFAIDIYGNGTHAANDEEAGKLMAPLFLNRKKLRKRINAAFKAISEHPMVDPDRIAAIGFCFGGTSVIELMRSGAKVKGVVSFHASLNQKIGNKKAILAPNAKKLYGSLLILQGNEDPMATEKDLQVIKKEFDNAGIDWQLNLYSHTAHAFTNPERRNAEKGLIFNPKANHRAFESMRNFLKEIFPPSSHK